MDFKNLFESEPLKINENLVKENEDKSQQKELQNRQQKLLQKNKEENTVFIGNLSINANKKDIQQHFQTIGKIEKIWFRNIPTDPSVKLSQKAKVITKQLDKEAHSMTCYVEFNDKESVKNCIEQMNNTVFMGRHLHITKVNHVEKDYRSTVFIGNLSFVSDEEELREILSKFGAIEYIRIIRDKITHKTKGFCYVKFSQQKDAKNLVTQKIKYKENELRISMAKWSQKEQTNKGNAIQRIQRNKYRKISKK